MGTGSMLLTCLLLASGQGAGDTTIHTNQRNHRVPINIEPGRRQEVQEMRLFVSADKGNTWRQEGVIPPEKDGFVFYAPGDGEFWLRVAAVNRNGKQEPENIYQVPAESTIKMMIDTLKPVVKLVTAQRTGDEIAVAWEVTEEHPEPKTLKLEYQIQGGPPSWTIVPIEPKPAARVSFRPGSPAAVIVRLTFQDKAGNVSSQTAEVTGTATTAAAGFGPASGPPSSAPPAPAPVPPPFPAGNDMRASPPPVAESAMPGNINQPRPVTPTGYNTIPPPPPAVLGGPGPVQAVPPPVERRPIASTDMPSAAAPSYSIPQQPLPPVRYVNARKLVLEYQLSKIGPSGPGTVDLWWTPDNGKTWEHAPRPVNPLTRMPMKVEEEKKSDHYEREVDLQEGDGVYGFAVVVRSRAGIGKQPPRSGDVPEIRVELDTTPPQAKLYAPRPDPLHHESLILSWLAHDKNLAETPISLEYALQPTGPWQQIALDQPNDGRFSWQPPAGLIQVYLRLRARDKAGNEAMVVSPEPQLVDLTEPEGRLVNVVPQRP